jgi:hypothetical protein
MSSQVADIAGADVFGAAPYANIINVKTHGMYGANAGGVSRGKPKSLYKSKSLQLYSKHSRTCTPTFRRIQRSYRGAGLNMCKDRLSPLQRIEIHADQILCKCQIEEKVASVVPPWWTPPQINIADTAEKARKHHDRVQRESGQEPGHLVLYSDGSDIKGRVGASSWCPKLRRQM